MSFRGRYEHTIDAKGRTSVPARFREVLSALGDNLVVTAGIEPCLYVYPLKVWEEWEQKIAARNPNEKGIKEILRTYVANATDVDVDKLGRVLLPPNLRDFAKLEKDIIWVGQIRHMELWSTTNWAKAVEDALNPEHKLDLERVFAELR